VETRSELKTESGVEEARSPNRWKKQCAATKIQNWITNNHRRRSGQAETVWNQNGRTLKTSGGKRKPQSQNTRSVNRGGNWRPKTRQTTPNGKRGGAAVRGKCTTGVYIYMVKKLLDLGKKRWGFFFSWFKREKVVKLIFSVIFQLMLPTYSIYLLVILWVIICM
jgi:hypothetical protein